MKLLSSHYKSKHLFFSFSINALSSSLSLFLSPNVSKKKNSSLPPLGGVLEMGGECMPPGSSPARGRLEWEGRGRWWSLLYACVPVQCQCVSDRRDRCDSVVCGYSLSFSVCSTKMHTHLTCSIPMCQASPHLPYTPHSHTHTHTHILMHCTLQWGGLSFFFWFTHLGDE